MEDKTRKSGKGKGAAFGLIIAVAIVAIVIGIIFIIINKDYITGTIIVIIGFVLVAIMNSSKVRAKFMSY
jgi:uncharacterized membrane protein